MKTITEHIRERLEKSLPRQRPDLDSLRSKQWSKTFETLMRNRLIVGALRYETFEEKRLHNGYDIAGSIRARIDAYAKDGNLEHMVDIANLCMIEFESPSHRNPTWEAIDDGIHVERK